MVLHDAAGQRHMDRVAARARPAHVDAYDVAALGRRDHDRGVAAERRRVARRVHARDVRHQVGQRLRHPRHVHRRLDRRRVHRELRPARPDQLDRAVDGRGHQVVQADQRAVQPVLAAVQPLEGQHVVDQGGDPGGAGRQVVQDLVRLGPQLPGRVGRQAGQRAAQLGQRRAQRTVEQRTELLGAGLQRVVLRPVGERHHRADQLVPVPHRRRRQVDGHRLAVLAPQHLAAHPVLAARPQGVGERGLLVRQRGAVRAGVVHQRVQLLAAEVGRPEAEDLRRRRVDQHDLARGVHADHALGGGPQDHLGLPLLAGEFGLGVDRAGQVADDQHQQFVAGVVRDPVAVVRVRGAAVLQVRARHLDRELAAVRAPRQHPGRLGPGVLLGLLRAAHRARDALGVERRQQVQQAAAHQRGAGRLERLQGDRVRVHHRAVGVDQQQRVREGVQYRSEASSASGWPAAHETRPPCYRMCCSAWRSARDGAVCRVRCSSGRRTALSADVTGGPSCRHPRVMSLDRVYGSGFPLWPGPPMWRHRVGGWGLYGEGVVCVTGLGAGGCGFPAREGGGEGGREVRVGGPEEHPDE